MRAVSIPPSHRRNVRSPMLVATASIRDSLSSHPSSGARGPGYYSGKAIEWFGRNCINGIEDIIIFKRCWQYQYRLKQWSSSKGGGAGRKRDKQFSTMLEDLLELSRSALSGNFWHYFDYCYRQRLLLRPGEGSSSCNRLPREQIGSECTFKRRSFDMEDEFYALLYSAVSQML